MLTTLKNKIDTCVAQTTALKAQIQETTLLKESIASIRTRVQNDVADLKDRLSAIGLAAEDIIQFSVDLQPLETKIGQLQAAVAVVEKDNALSFENFNDFDTLETLPDLRAAYAYCNEFLEQLKDHLGAPQRRYQAYVEQLAVWEDKQLQILGDTVDPKQGTIRQLEATVRYLENDLGDYLEEKYTERRAIVKNIFQSKNTVLDFYNDLRKSVEDSLQSAPTEGFEIEIDASFVVDQGFQREFLNHVDQRKRGPFRNDQDAQAELARRIQGGKWDDDTTVVEFCEDLIKRMKKHNGEELSIADQVHDVKSLYDFVFSLDYLTARYELRLGGKNLNELSPGEKGLLLLIFYLRLDRKNTPLVIDQPEDNLDNDSIFKVLAASIRDAKARRQVILVTHNPNLAVGADAEQIVYVKLEKAENYKFSYESGAIENPGINRRIIDVLEGSQPAFVKRRLKYGI